MFVLISNLPNAGVAVTDVNNDGKSEFVTAGNGNPNKAYTWDAASQQFVNIAQEYPSLQDSSRQAIGVAACDIGL